MTMHIVQPEVNATTIALGVKALAERAGLSTSELGEFIHDLAGDVWAVLEAVEYPHLQRKFAVSQRVADEAISKRAQLEREVSRLNRELAKLRKAPEPATGALGCV